jgi:hypothetical protein
MKHYNTIYSTTLRLSLFFFSIQALTGQTPNIKLSFKPQLLCIDNNEACAIADINQDGLDDVVAGRLWYAAPDFVPRPVRAIALHPPDYARNNGEHIWDVNQDGWPDVVTTGWGETRILWYKNPGKIGLEKGLPWSVHTLADAGHGHGEIGSMKDINADGVPEYIVNSYQKTNPFALWAFDADASGDPIMEAAIIGKQNSHGVGFGDVNNDGRMDILFDDGWYEHPVLGLADTPWTLHRDWQLVGGSCPMQVVDLNHDGRNDIIWGQGHNYGLYWLEQNPPVNDSTTWTSHLIDSSWSQVHVLAWEDLDGDGLKELLAGKRIFAHSGKDPGSDDPAFIYRYIWNPSKNAFRRETIAEGRIGTGLFIRVADLNADDKKDIVIAGKTGTYILWQK